MKYTFANEHQKLVGFLTQRPPALSWAGQRFRISGSPMGSVTALVKPIKPARPAISSRGINPSPEVAGASEFVRITAVQRGLQALVWSQLVIRATD
jgi:hypothetical protein